MSEEAMVDDTGAGETRELVISRIGHEGDGIALTVDETAGGGMVFVPFTLPGERVRAEVTRDRGRLVEVLAASPQRARPICRHFGACGGCAMQHVSAPAYTAWKSDLVSRALAQHGLDARLEPMVVAAPRTRRRAVLGAKRGPHGVIVGFHEPRGHRILDIAECPILAPAIAERLPALRDLVHPLLPRYSSGGAKGDGGLRIVATAADNGLDVVIEGAGAGSRIGPAEREAIAEVARAARILRVSLDRDPIYVATEPMIRFGTVDVVPPPGVFLQAVGEVERAMAARIVEAVAKTKGRGKRVADLFCGLGTFSFPIAAEAEVLAADSDRRALAALDAAFRRAKGIKPITTLVRDLHLEPMSAKELEGYDVVVFDPPRAGAADQAQRIARCKASTVVAVSCAPGTLARDLAILTAGGFAIESVTPYDQFLYSPHVETVAVLRRPRR